MCPCVCRACVYAGVNVTVAKKLGLGRWWSPVITFTGDPCMSCFFVWPMYVSAWGSSRCIAATAQGPAAAAAAPYGKHSISS
jgi:hypothetical protein